jgi:hypothetical protein
MMRFGLRIRPVQREILSALLRAGSSLRLKDGYAQDDNSGEQPFCSRLGGGADAPVDAIALVEEAIKRTESYILRTACAYGAKS